jgi:putative phosphoribosyl transferase
MLVDAGFIDRIDAGNRLAQPLESYRDSEAIILGLARGGVVVGYAVAGALNLPLRALIVRKMGAPGNPELAIGAVSETGVRWVDREIARVTGADEAYIEREAEVQTAGAQRRQREFAGSHSLEIVSGRTAIIVDDGIATGSSALVAIRSARGLGASHVILAVPTAPAQSIANLRAHVDELVALSTPDPFVSVGLHYDHFGQVSDAEVVRYLRDAQERERGT